MKYTAIFVLLTITCAFAGTNQMSTLLQNQARAADAVDSALDVLKGLKQANVDAQELADAENKTNEAIMAAEISDLTAICDSNKEAGDAATEHRKYIEERIDVTNQYLQWIVARRQELNRKRVELSEQRCASNAAFVIALKEHDEALAVVALLKQDVVGVVEEHTGEHYEGLAEIKNAAQKIGAFAHLFEKKQMEEFAQLAQSNPAQEVDAEWHEWDTNADDNDKAALEVEFGAYAGAERDVSHRFIDMLNTLEQHLHDSIADLEKNEIQSAWDLSQWLQDSNAELVWLDEEQEANVISIDKLVIAVVGAKSHEERLWDIYFDSAQVLNDSLAKREVIRQRYLEEKARRDEENLVLDDIIQLFIDQVATLSAKGRAGATDYADDGSFNQSTGVDYNADGVDAIAGDVADANAAANAAAAAAPY